MSHVGKLGFKCIGCGACESICPKKCVEVFEVGRKGLRAFVVEEQCASCGLCLEVCPIEDLKIPDDLERAKKVYRGYSRNKDIYLNSASGGGVSSLLWAMFDENLIDAALVAHYDEYLHIYGDFITSKEEVLTYSGSFYQTCKQLVNLKNIRQYRSVAVVGLPCHISAFKKYADKFGINNVYITISLFCTVGRMREGLKDFLRDRKEEILLQTKAKRYKSRFGEKRDGTIFVETLDGSRLDFSYFEYSAFVSHFYTPDGCLNCRKLFGLHADISVGDDWGIVSDKKIFLMSINSDKGFNVLNKCSSLLELQDLGNNTVRVLIQSQPDGAALKIAPPEWKKVALLAIKGLGRFNRFPLLRKAAYRFRWFVLKILRKCTRQKVYANKTYPVGGGSR